MEVRSEMRLGRVERVERAGRRAIEGGIEIVSIVIEAIGTLS